jgi:predicted peptidase
MAFKRLSCSVTLPEFAWEYVLHYPKSYSLKGEPWPLLVILHGRGERGSMDRLETNCIPRIISEFEEDRFVVLAPSCPIDNSWPLLIGQLDQLLSKVLETEHVDRHRVYLTGYSMGGNGAWIWASRSTARFAALVPICPGGRDGYWLFDIDPIAGGTVDNEWHCGSLFSQQLISRLKDVPIRAFHGYRDATHPLSDSLVLSEQLKAIGADVELETLDAGHIAWPLVYENRRIYDWLLFQKLD